MIDLGWTNANAVTEHAIREQVKKCKDLGHTLNENRRGSFGTWHVYSCDLCDYTYSEDSGD